ncbi:hypothetical protein INR49_016806 [Caranx melampygus]|nr:hypothetical protein INR49_016806 [Caranx melampygus]
MMSAHWERRRTAMTQLLEQLQSLPAFSCELDAITANIAHLEGDFEEMESRLVYLETLCCQCEQQMVKEHHINHLDAYKKKKRKEVEALEVELNNEHTQKVAELEQARQQKLRERQKVYEEAFNQDMEQYLSTGYLQHREPPGADVCVLDQMKVANISDEEALDEFLNSTGDVISHGSSLTSDLDACSSDSSRSQVNQAPPALNQPFNREGVWEQEEDMGSEESNELLVQLDEEDVQPDISLVGLHDVDAGRCSDESDSTGDLPSG